MLGQIAMHGAANFLLVLVLLFAGCQSGPTDDPVPEDSTPTATVESPETPMQAPSAPEPLNIQVTAGRQEAPLIFQVLVDFQVADSCAVRLNASGDEPQLPASFMAAVNWNLISTTTTEMVIVARNRTLSHDGTTTPMDIQREPWTAQIGEAAGMREIQAGDTVTFTVVALELAEKGLALQVDCAKPHIARFYGSKSVDLFVPGTFPQGSGATAPALGAFSAGESFVRSSERSNLTAFLCYDLDAQGTHTGLLTVENSIGPGGELAIGDDPGISCGFVFSTPGDLRIQLDYERRGEGTIVVGAAEWELEPSLNFIYE